MVRYGVIPVSERATNQLIQREMPLIEKLIELITNSDDSYRKMAPAGYGPANCCFAKVRVRANIRGNGPDYL